MNGVAGVAGAGGVARDWRTPLLLLLVGAVFGSSFLFMRVAAPEMGPQALVGVRLACGSLVLLPFVWRARRQLPLRRWPMIALIGVVNAAVPFLLFAWAAQRAPAAIGAICNAMAVLFTTLVAFVAFGAMLVYGTLKIRGPSSLASAVARLAHDPRQGAEGRAVYDCPRCGAPLGCSADVSPGGDAKCPHCGSWFNVRAK